jgi:hypothetical protein
MVIRQPYSIARYLLNVHDQIARLAILPWLEELRSQLALVEHLPTTTVRWRSVIATCANRCALIESYRGKSASARRLCEIQWRWLESESNQNGAVDARALAIQPWINLGRLDWLGGDLDGALRRFAVFGELSETGKLSMGELAVPSRAWVHIGFESPQEQRRFGKSVFVVESLKAQLGRERYTETLTFADNVPRADEDGVRGFLEEAVVIALAGLGRIVAALNRALDTHRNAISWQRLISQFRCAELLAMAEDRNNARKLCGMTWAACDRLRLDASPQLFPLFLTAGVATLAAHLGEIDLAIKANIVVVRGARLLGDEPLELEALLRLCSIVETGHMWDDTLRRRRKESGYSRFRLESTPNECDAAANAMRTELEQRMAAATVRNGKRRVSGGHATKIRDSASQQA